MSAPLLLTSNSGSSTIKIGLFSVSSNGATRIGQGTIDFRRALLSLRLVNDGTVHDIAKEVVTEQASSGYREGLSSQMASASTAMWNRGAYSKPLLEHGHVNPHENLDMSNKI